jgi:pyruvate formate lyase activating enzyme
MSTARDGLTGKPVDPGDVRGVIFNIQRFSIQDGPGIRSTVFLKGCPLRCQWCSNPESQNSRPEIAHRDSLCNQCGLCVTACKAQAITPGKKGVTIDRKLCTDCGDCVKVCVPGALKVFGETMSAAEVFSQIKKDADFYRESGGGVTVSGGEPLMQADFVAALFQLCWENGIHTCMETCGLASAESLNKVLPYTSLVLFDIKLSDSDTHRLWTQAPNEEIIRNLGKIAARKIPFIIRIPLIPGVNDTEEELENIARLIARNLKRFPKINLLPYHKYGMGKYQMLDREYKLEDLNTQPATQVQQHKRLFESLGFECDIEG